MWVVVIVTCVLLSKLASKHATSDHGSRLPSRRLGSLHSQLGHFFTSTNLRHYGGMMRVGGVGAEGG